MAGLRAAADDGRGMPGSRTPGCTPALQVSCGAQGVKEVFAGGGSGGGSFPDAAAYKKI